MNEQSMKAGPARVVVKSADRALDVIEHVTRTPTPPTFTMIARALQLPKSSLSQLLNNLVARRYLDLDPQTATYRPGLELLALVRRSAKIIPLRALVMPVLEQLRDELNETSGFYALNGDEIELVGSATSRHALVYIMNVGERAPLYTISSGKAILSHMREDALAAYLARVPLKRFTPDTITDAAALKRELADARRDGFAYSKGEYSPGIHGVACVVVVDGRTIGAVSVSIPMVRFDEALHTATKRALSMAADELTRVLTAREQSSTGE